MPLGGAAYVRPYPLKSQPLPICHLGSCQLWQEYHSLVYAAENFDVQFTDLFAQRIPVDPQEFGRLDLIAASRLQGDADQRAFDLPKHALIEAAGGEPRSMGCEI